ncbi:MAG: response regulator transcription factor [Thermotaleaceae bacterium]
MKTVLLVDEEKRMLDLLDLYISPHGYKCIKKQSGIEAISYLENKTVDLVILDIMMTEMDGWNTCEKIRAISNIPIIILTALDAIEDVIKGLKIGADDYITKPFEPEELLARMEAILRRTYPVIEEPLEYKGLTLDEGAFKIACQNQSIFMTPTEFSILKLFVANPNKVFTRKHLITIIWSFKLDIADRTIDSHIRNIREKLRHVDFPVDEHLKTVWGVGFKWSAESHNDCCS